MKINTIPRFQLLVCKLVMVMLTAMGSVSVAAQNYPDRNYPGAGPNNQGDGYVTVFDDCNFRGTSRSLAVGEYLDVRELGIRNDSVSSVQVPPGMEVTLFKHERLAGATTTLNQDVTCLNKEWNDQASSLRIRYVNQDRSVYGQNQNRSGQYQNRPGVMQGNQYRNPAVNATAVTKVYFANTALEKIARQQWRIVNPNGTVEGYQEVNRNQNSIYLQNTNGPGQVEINLAANNVRFTSVSGQQLDYQINGTEPGSGNTRRSAADTVVRPAPVAAPSGLIQNRCFDFKAYTRGGDGGIRFHGHEGFNAFREKAHSGQICHEGQLTMEVSKMDPATEVIVEIEGSKYVFASGDKGDTLLNNWYRKMTSLKVVPR